jgi:hypothetical protein
MAEYGGFPSLRDTQYNRITKKSLSGPHGREPSPVFGGSFNFTGFSNLNN